MFVAGIDAHATYSVIAIVSNTSQLVHEPVRIDNTDEERLHELFEPYRPLEVVRNLSTTMGHSTGLIREQCPVW